MLKKILYVIIFIVFAYFVLCILGPKKMDVSTKKSINASATAIFSQIADLRNMKNWSKWILEDTAMTLTYGKTTSGIGGTYSWKSKSSGEGSMTIKAVDENKMLAYDLNFKDWDATSDVKMLLVPNGKTTDVTWSMVDQKENAFYWRGLMLLMNMNGRIKKDFDKGLENLDKYLQANPNVILANGFTINEGKYNGNDYLSKRSVVNFADISNYFATHFTGIGKLAGSSVTGVPCGLYWKYDEKNRTADMAAAMPVSKKDFNNDIYSIISLPAGKEFLMNYYGAYDKMQSAYQTMDSIIKMNGYTNPEVVIEEYITDPMSQKDTALWHTKIHFLVK